MTNEILKTLKQLVCASQRALEGAEASTLDSDCYAEDMEKVRKYIAKAHKLFEHRSMYQS